jgi:hypothetical protein
VELIRHGQGTSYGTTRKTFKDGQRKNLRQGCAGQFHCRQTWHAQRIDMASTLAGESVTHAA